MCLHFWHAEHLSLGLNRNIPLDDAKDPGESSIFASVKSPLNITAAMQRKSYLILLRIGANVDQNANGKTCRAKRDDLVTYILLGSVS